MRRDALLIGCLLGGLLLSPAVALPRFSVMVGEGCTTCHLNPSGQGLRNRYGVEVFGTRELAQSRREALKTVIGERLRIGGDLRVQPYFYLDDRAGVASADPNAQTTGTETTIGLFTMQTDLYLAWDLQDQLTIYLETDLLNQTAEVFGMWDPKGEAGYLKVGRFLPNYGLRIDDHTAFIRGGNPRSRRQGLTDGLFWGPNYSDSGLETGFRLLGLQWTLGAFNGEAFSPLNDDRELALLGRVERFVRLSRSTHLLLGGNVYSSQNPTQEALGRLLLAGGFLGIGGKSWTLTAEADWAQDYLPANGAAQTGSPTRGAHSLAIFVEGAVRAAQGVYLLARLEHFDPDLDADGQRFWRGSLGAEWYPVPYLEIKPTLRYTDQGTDQVRLLEALLQLHGWL
ncbi:MAG: hypothetical protein KatS3mg115_1361 [Candidatus Poribacteria bacterium]|nr:MAG: hypothetical protein KatS3mg115_1361 [Candidatus Poribacteria bacterium]